MVNVSLEVVLVAIGVVMLKHLSVSRSTASLVRHVLPIVLLVNGSAVFAQVIHAPRLIEGDALLLGERVAEFSYGNLQSWESGLELFSYRTEIRGPVAGYWVQAGEHLKEGSAEGGAHDGMAVFPVAVSGKLMKNKPSGTGASNSKQPKVNAAESNAEDIHPSVFVWLLLAFAPLLPFFQSGNAWGGFKTPNVEVNRHGTD